MAGVVLAALLVGRAAVLTAEEGRRAESEVLRYSGRHFPIGDAEGIMWSSAGVACRVSGTTKVQANVTGPADGARLRIRINDNTWAGTVKLGSGKKKELVTLATGLDVGSVQTVMLLKVSEDNSQDGDQGALRFHGFVVDEGAQFHQVPALPERRLEFIGDSDTAGFCVDGNPSGGDNDNKVEDSTETWAAQIADAVGAQTMVEAVSGWGVTKKSTPIQPLLPYADGVGGKHAWDPSSWIPDAVFMLIGPNDYTSNKDPTKSHFIAAYTELLSYVNNSYSPYAPTKVIHVCGGSGNGFDPCENIKTASDDWNKLGTAVSSHYVQMNRTVWNTINKGTKEYNGCDGHYNPNGHRLLAQDVLPEVKAILGW